MIGNSQWRTNFLITISVGIGLVNVYSCLEPTAGNRPVASFSFPEFVPLNSWKLNKTEQLFPQKKEIDSQENLVKSSKSYTYKKNSIPLKVEMRYVVGTRGDVEGLIKEETNIPPEFLKQQNSQYLKDLGFHTRFIYEGQAYLSACINPRGGSTYTHKQFSLNRYAYDFNFNLLLDWLIGKASIRDRRCLWAHLSTPVDSLKPQKSYQILEQAWSNWYQWWQPRFPSL
jgi:cyanosortase A-associated protein